MNNVVMNNNNEPIAITDFQTVAAETLEDKVYRLQAKMTEKDLQINALIKRIEALESNSSLNSSIFRR